MESIIRDINLAPAGKVKIAWAANHMPVLARLHRQVQTQQPLKGLKISMCLHLEAKTAYLAQVVQAAGAQVAVCASNPLSTQDDVVAALAESGVTAFARHGAGEAEYHQHLDLACTFGPQLVVDDGADLVVHLHGPRRQEGTAVWGGSEETTTGITRLRALAGQNGLMFPMIAVNDALSKHLFDNRYGTGQSVWDGIMRSTNLVVAGKTAVVVGYGWCGKGVALRARGLGARVIVCEVDPVKANEALMDGHQVMPLLQAAPQADFVITVTGNSRVLDRSHLEALKDGTILANAGHFDVEIDKPSLESLAAEISQVRPGVTQYRFSDQRRVYLLGEGRLVNLANGDGHPAEIMDMSFALQALSLLYLAREHNELPQAVLPVPRELDLQVARERLAALGIAIDELTPEQQAYGSSYILK